MDEKSEKIKNTKINRVLGMFILFFGIVILISMAFTETFIGQMTNLVAGGILCLIGAGMIFQAMRTMKKLL
jgi:putative Mn2+ efflux pump MntP